MLGQLCSKASRESGEPTRLPEGTLVRPLLPLWVGALSTLAAPISSVKPQQQWKTEALLLVVFCFVGRFPVFYFHLPFQDLVPNFSSVGI